MARNIASSAGFNCSVPVPSQPAPARSATLIQPNTDLDGSPRRIEKEIWLDRLKVQKQKQKQKQTKKKRGEWGHTSPPPPNNLEWWPEYIEDSLKGLREAIGNRRAIQTRNQRGTLG